MKKSFVYIVTNHSKTTLYIGVTANIVERITQHKNKIGSYFTIKYNLNYVVYIEEFDRIEDAIKREKQLKKWNREWKENLINKDNPEWKDLMTGEIIGEIKDSRLRGNDEHSIIHNL